MALYTWSAVIGAFADQGIKVTSKNRGAGIVQGNRKGINLFADVRTQADGKVRIDFKSCGTTDRGPDLIQRISQAYERRMGR